MRFFSGMDGAKSGVWIAGNLRSGSDIVRDSRTSYLHHYGCEMTAENNRRPPRACAWCGEEVTDSGAVEITTRLPGKPRARWHAFSQEKDCANEDPVYQEIQNGSKDIRASILQIQSRGPRRIKAGPLWAQVRVAAMRKVKP